MQPEKLSEALQGVITIRVQVLWQCYQVLEPFPAEQLFL